MRQKKELKGAGLGSLYNTRAALGTRLLDEIDCSTSCFFLSPRGGPTQVAFPVSLKLLPIYCMIIFRCAGFGR